MVRTLASIFLTALLVAGICVYEELYVKNRFQEFGEAVTALYQKTEEKTANAEDAKAVRTLWAKEKKTLHIWIPHTDVSYIDYWLNECLGLIYVQDYTSALPKLEVLSELCKSLPDTYAVSWENIF